MKLRASYKWPHADSLPCKLLFSETLVLNHKPETVKKMLDKTLNANIYTRNPCEAQVLQSCDFGGFGGLGVHALRFWFR